MAEPVVELRNVTFRYPGVAAREAVLEDVSLEVEAATSSA